MRPFVLLQFTRQGSMSKRFVAKNCSHWSHHSLYTFLEPNNDAGVLTLVTDIKCRWRI